MTFEIVSNEADSFLAKREQRSLEFDVSTLTPPFPKTALFELTNWCNHACVFCTNPRMVRKHGALDLELYKKTVKEAVALGLEEVGLYTTGEPFFTKNLDEFVAAAKQAGVRYVYVTTNGALATPDRVVPVIEAGLSSIKFSVNAGSRETYKLVHGRDDFEKVLANIKFISEYRKTHAPHLKMMASSVVTRFTAHEKEKLKQLLLPFVDDIGFYPVGGQGGQNLDQLEFLKNEGIELFPEAGKANPCAMLWNRVHITCEGFLNLCCIDYENALTYADLRKSSLKEAWHNQVVQEMRKRHQEQKLEGTLCHQCLYGTKGKVHPIASVGGVNPAAELKSQNPKGVTWVSERIEGLAEIKDRAKL